MVKKLANLWANSVTTTEKVYIGRPSSASSSRTSSTTSLALPPRPQFAFSHSRQSTLSTSTSSQSLSSSRDRDGAFYLQMRPGTTDSSFSTRPPGITDSAININQSEKYERRSYFDEQLLARLHTLDWEEQQTEARKPKVSISLHFI